MFVLVDFFSLLFQCFGQGCLKELSSQRRSP